MADEPRREEPDQPARPDENDSTADAHGGTRGKKPEEAPEEVVDDDRFQATDN